jgi:hypothetical protein
LAWATGFGLSGEGEPHFRPSIPVRDGHLGQVKDIDATLGLGARTGGEVKWTTVSEEGSRAESVMSDIPEIEPAFAPNYREDKFFGVRWHWLWQGTSPANLRPRPINPICPSAFCIEPMDATEVDGSTTLTCSSGLHDPVTLAGSFEEIRSRVAAEIMKRAPRA